jgi:hypothetical protein
MSSATVNTEERDSLLSNEVDVGITSGGVSPNPSQDFFGIAGLFGATSGAKLAGVTEKFAGDFATKFTAYKAAIDKILDDLGNAESDGAFKGTAIGGALTKFVNSVREVAKSYLAKYETAENQIINSVAKAYEKQDKDLSENLGTDSDSLSSTKVANSGAEGEGEASTGGAATASE